MGVAKKTGVEGLNSQSSAGLVHSSRECTAIRDACDAWRKLSQLSGKSWVALRRFLRNGSRASWPRSRVVLGLNGAGAERRSDADEHRRGADAQDGGAARGDRSRINDRLGNAAQRRAPQRSMSIRQGRAGQAGARARRRKHSRHFGQPASPLPWSNWASASKP
jgi:hypothetical protein